MEPSPSGVDLYWLPLGAGPPSARVTVVQFSGRLYEALAARLDRRRPCDLYHSALEVRLRNTTHVIEMTPIPDAYGSERGVVAEGAVGSRLARELRRFRYEVRRWRDGAIPDVDQAVASPLRLTNDGHVAERVLDLVPQVPTLVWGRDEVAAGEMWNSNSLISWLIESSGLDAEALHPPGGGRAPGWSSGVVVARRQARSSPAGRRAADAGVGWATSAAAE